MLPISYLEGREEIEEKRRGGREEEQEGRRRKESDKSAPPRGHTNARITKGDHRGRFHDLAD